MTRFAPLYGMTAACFVLVLVLARNPQRAPWQLLAYLVTTFAFGVTAAWGLHRPEDTKTTAYLAFYLSGLVMTLALAFAVAWKFTEGYPAWFRAAVFIAGFFVGALCVVAAGMKGAQGFELLLQGYFLTALAFAASFGLYGETERTALVVKLGCTALWAGLAWASVACALERDVDRAMRLSQIVPATIGLLVFGFMAGALVFAQGEGARVLDEGNQRAAESLAAEAAMQRRARD